jgi:hypothetical protein
MQTVSGSFGVLAYLIGGILGNIFLIYFGIIIALLATIIPAFLIHEPRELKNAESEKIVAVSKSSAKDIVESLLPLTGFILYGIYVIFGKLFGLHIDVYINILGYNLGVVEFVSVFLILLSAIAVLLNLAKTNTKSNEFQKVLLAHSFTWIGVQTMFIYAFFYLTIVLQLGDNAGKTNSIAFFILSLVSAVLPVLVLNGFAKRIGMVRTIYYVFS